MALNPIIENVTRSIHQAIRKVLVEEGYLPDIESTTFQKNGDSLTPAGKIAWEAAIAQIASTKGFAIELFSGYGSYERGLKKIPRIVINPQRLIPGEIGLTIQGTYTKTGETYVKEQNPSESSIQQYDIHLIGNTTSQCRVLNQVLHRALGSRKYILFYNDITQRFFILQYNYYNLPDPQEGIVEDIYSYEVQDLYIFDISESNKTTISPIKNIDVDVMDNSNNDNLGTINVN